MKRLNEAYTSTHEHLQQLARKWYEEEWGMPIDAPPQPIKPIALSISRVRPMKTSEAPFEMCGALLRLAQVK